MGAQVKTKDASGTRRIILDWSTYLGTSEVSDATWTVPSDLTAANESVTTTTTTNYFSGGVDGQEYEIKCCITTNDSPARIKCFSFVLGITAQYDIA